MNIIKDIKLNILIAGLLCVFASGCTTTDAGSSSGVGKRMATKEPPRTEQRESVASLNLAAPPLKLTAPSLDVLSGSTKPPRWVLKGSGAYVSEEGRVFYAVSSAYGISNEELLLRAADSRSKGAMSGLLQGFLELAIADYVKEMDEGTLALRGGADIFGEKIFKSLEAVLRKGAASSRMLARWSSTAQGQNTNELYSLYTLRLSEFIASAGVSSKVDRDFRKYLKLNADKFHSDLYSAKR